MTRLISPCALACVVFAAVVDVAWSGSHRYGRNRYRYRYTTTTTTTTTSPPIDDPACTTPNVFHVSGTYSDTDEFFETFDQSLLGQQCGYLNSAKGTSCNKYFYDWPYTGVYYYLKNACDFDYSRASYLQDLVLDYCAYHCPESDDAVTEAYTCSSGCRLADHLNQLCKDLTDSQPAPPAGQWSGSWIGLTDRATEKVYRWVAPANPADFTDWAIAEPVKSNAQFRDCVVMTETGWLPMACFQKCPFVCETAPIN